MVFRTKHFRQYLSGQVATNLYDRLQSTIPWHEGIRSKRGFTRMAYRVDDIASLDDDILSIIAQTVSECAGNDYAIAGVYLNYYRTGRDYTPAHSHPGTVQLIISLGATRTLVVGKKEIPLANGDVAVFGSSVHGVPRDETINDGRISIALFLVKERND